VCQSVVSQLQLEVGHVVAQPGVEDKFAGDAINVAQRLESEAAGGEILAAAATIAEARWEGAEPAGERLLKGRHQPVRVFRVPVA
jgi:class 3 adenylate cyclase